MMQHLGHTSLFALCLCFGALPARAIMQPSAPDSNKIQRVEIQKSDVPGTNLEMRVLLVTYPPGAAAPSITTPL